MIGACVHLTYLSEKEPLAPMHDNGIENQLMKCGTQGFLKELLPLDHMQEILRQLHSRKPD